MDTTKVVDGSWTIQDPEKLKKDAELKGETELKQFNKFTDCSPAQRRVLSASKHNARNVRPPAKRSDTKNPKPRELVKRTSDELQNGRASAKSRTSRGRQRTNR